MSRQKIKLGIFGFGCVGQGLYDVLSQTRGIEAEIVKICVKDKDKPRRVDPSLITFDRKEILDNPDIDVVVELIDDPKAAHEIVTEALRNEKAVVSANKKLIAENFEELYQLQQKHSVPFLYEAACCASIPVIRNLEEYYDNDQLNGVEGIFNGSTNYILSKQKNEQKSYAVALKEAQDAGFAESDPTLDVGGFDPKYKLAIILGHAFGLFVHPDALFNYGIDRLTDYDLQKAREQNHTIKLVATCKKVDDKVRAFVAPFFLPSDAPLSKVDNEYNGVEIEGVFSEHQFFVGKGAGGYPTGSAVLSDISALTYGYRYEYKKRHQQLGLTLDDHFLVDVYVRAHDSFVIQQSDFEHVHERFVSPTNSYVSGRIYFRKLIESGWINDPDVSVIFYPEGYF